MPFADNSADPRGRPPQIPPQTCFLCLPSQLAKPSNNLLPYNTPSTQNILKRVSSNEKAKRGKRESHFFCILFLRAGTGIMTTKFQFLVLFLWIYRSSLDLRIREGMYHDGESTNISNKFVDELEIEVARSRVRLNPIPCLKRLLLITMGFQSSSLAPSVNQAPPKLKARLARVLNPVESVLETC